MAVVEVILVERGLDGVVKGQYVLGWALLPLFRVCGALGPLQRQERPRCRPCASEALCLAGLLLCAGRPVC